MPEYRTLVEIEADLRRPIPAHLLKQKEKKDKKTGKVNSITFFSWITAMDLLNAYAPGWQIRNPQAHLALDGAVVYTLELGIPTSDHGIVWRPGEGQALAEGYGEPVTRASRQALKRAAGFFGMGEMLYRKGQGRPQVEKPDPLESARNMVRETARACDMTGEDLQRYILERWSGRTWKSLSVEELVKLDLILTNEQLPRAQAQRSPQAAHAA